MFKLRGKKCNYTVIEGPETKNGSLSFVNTIFKLTTREISICMNSGKNSKFKFTLRCNELERAGFR